MQFCTELYGRGELHGPEVPRPTLHAARAWAYVGAGDRTVPVAGGEEEIGEREISARRLALAAGNDAIATSPKIL